MHVGFLYFKSLATVVIGNAQVFQTKDHVGIALEYAAGGNMYQLVAGKGGLSEPDARRYFQQIICAVDYYHQLVRTCCRLSIPCVKHVAPQCESTSFWGFGRSWSYAICKQLVYLLDSVFLCFRDGRAWSIGI